MPSSRTVIASLVRTVLNGAAMYGVTPDEVLSLASLDERPLQDPDARVPYEHYLAVWNAAAQLSRDPDFGLNLARKHVDASTFNVVGFIARSSATFEEAIRLVVDYTRVLNETTETYFTQENGLLNLVDSPADRASPWPRHKAECLIATYVVLGRRWTGEHWSPREVRFQHSAPANLAAHQKLFGCPVRFDQPDNGFSADAAILSLPLLHAEPELRAYLERDAAARLNRLQNADDLTQTLRQAVRRSLPRGGPSVEQAADMLAMTPRTLQRRLADDGLSYRDILDQIRREDAAKLLADPDVSVKETAFLLGFADERSFRRAFRRWNGVAPREYRSR